MKTIVVLAMFLVGCAGGGGGAAPAASVAPGLNPSCKSIYSVWSSTTDSEQWDFTSLAGAVTNPDYGWTASNGVTCGYASNPNHELTAQLTAVVNGHYQYQVATVATLAESGTCGLYIPPGSIGGRYGWVLIDMNACGEIQICHGTGGADICKTFH